jgi:hypothetical protein
MILNFFLKDGCSKRMNILFALKFFGVGSLNIVPFSGRIHSRSDGSEIQMQYAFWGE